MTEAMVKKPSVAQYKQEVVQMMVEALQKQLPPWRQPWDTGGAAVPFNVLSGRFYRGVNAWWLLLRNPGVMAWGTRKNWNDLLMDIRPGELPQFVTYAGFFWADKEGTPVRRMFLRVFAVYNYNQMQPWSVERILGLNNRKLAGLCRRLKLSPEEKQWKDKDKELFAHLVQERIKQKVQEKLNQHGSGVVYHHHERHQIAEQLISLFPVNFTQADEACYRPALKQIYVPAPERFSNLSRYYETVFHEIMHYLVDQNYREQIDRAVGTKDKKLRYAYEELVAEIGACYLLRRLGVPLDPHMTVQSQSYVEHWCSHISRDAKYIFSASSWAFTIADGMLSQVPWLQAEAV